MQIAISKIRPKYITNLACFQGLTPNQTLPSFNLQYKTPMFVPYSSICRTLMRLKLCCSSKFLSPTKKHGPQQSVILSAKKTRPENRMILQTTVITKKLLKMFLRAASLFTPHHHCLEVCSLQSLVLEILYFSQRLIFDDTSDAQRNIFRYQRS